MPPFANTDELYRTFDALFTRLRAESTATRTLQKSKVVIQLTCTQPDATITLNGRKSPPTATFGAQKIRPDVQIDMAAETLHQIFSGELSLKKAMSGKQVRVKGAVWKALALTDIFDRGKALYPEILPEIGASD